METKKLFFYNIFKINKNELLLTNKYQLDIILYIIIDNQKQFFIKNQKFEIFKNQINKFIKKYYNILLQDYLNMDKILKFFQ